MHRWILFCWILPALSAAVLRVSAGCACCTTCHLRTTTCTCLFHTAHAVLYTGLPAVHLHAASFPFCATFLPVLFVWTAAWFSAFCRTCTVLRAPAVHRRWIPTLRSRLPTGTPPACCAPAFPYLFCCCRVLPLCYGWIPLPVTGFYYLPAFYLPPFYWIAFCFCLCRRAAIPAGLRLHWFCRVHLLPPHCWLRHRSSPPPPPCLRCGCCHRFCTPGSVPFSFPILTQPPAWVQFCSAYCHTCQVLGSVRFYYRPPATCWFYLPTWFFVPHVLPLPACLPAIPGSPRCAV